MITLHTLSSSITRYRSTKRIEAWTFAVRKHVLEFRAALLYDPSTGDRDWVAVGDAILEVYTIMDEAAQAGITYELLSSIESNMPHKDHILFTKMMTIISDFPGFVAERVGV